MLPFPPISTKGNTDFYGLLLLCGVRNAADGALLTGLGNMGRLTQMLKLLSVNSDQLAVTNEQIAVIMKQFIHRIL